MWEIRQWDLNDKISFNAKRTVTERWKLEKKINGESSCMLSSLFSTVLWQFDNYYIKNVFEQISDNFKRENWKRMLFCNLKIIVKYILANMPATNKKNVLKYVPCIIYIVVYCSNFQESNWGIWTIELYDYPDSSEENCHYLQTFLTAITFFPNLIKLSTKNLFFTNSITY